MAEMLQGLPLCFCKLTLEGVGRHRGRSCRSMREKNRTVWIERPRYLFIKEEAGKRVLGNGGEGEWKVQMMMNQALGVRNF